MDYLYLQKASNKSTNWNHSGIVDAVLNVTQLMYLGQTHPTCTIFRAPTFNFSREFFKTYAFLISKGTMLHTFPAKYFSDFKP